MATQFDTYYNPKYPWRPTKYLDRCPECFGVFEDYFKCNNCGSGHDDYNLIKEKIKENKDENPR
jgi:rRNA maturation endonuclease Nob1